MYFKISQHYTYAFYFCNALLQYISQHCSTAVYYKPVTVLQCYTLDSVTELHCVTYTLDSVTALHCVTYTLDCSIFAPLCCCQNCTSLNPSLACFKVKSQFARKIPPRFFAKPNCAKKLHSLFC